MTHNIDAAIAVWNAFTSLPALLDAAKAEEAAAEAALATAQAQANADAAQIAQLQADLATAQARIAELEDQIANGGGGGGEPPPTPAPSVLTPPMITTAAPTVGERVEGTAGTWADADTFVHDWLLDDGTIAEANDTGLSTPVKAEYVGKRFILRITATGPGGTTSAESAPSNPVVEAGGGDGGNPPPPPPPPPSNGPVAFIAPDGEGDGSTRATAAPISSLNALIAAVGPGGEIRLLPGDYHVPTMGITNSGTAAGPIRITSDDPTRPAVLIGSRNSAAGSTPYVLPETPDDFRSVRGGAVWGGTGADLFNLNNVSFLVFDNFHFRQFARVFDLIGDTHDLAFHDLEGFNCQDYFYGRGYSVGAGAYNITIQRGKFAGGSKSCVSPAGSCHDWLIENVDYDSGYQVSDQFAMGFFVSDEARDITFRHCTSIRNLDYEGGDDTKFWNGDGFVTERDTRNIRFENCVSRFNSDGGFDMKCPNVQLVDCTSEGNKENFKIWNSATLTRCVSTAPAKTVMPRHGFNGGTGGACDLQVVGGNSADDPTVVNLISCTGMTKIQRPAHANAPSWFGQINVS